MPEPILGSYFLLKRTVTDIGFSLDEKRLFQLNIQTEEERYPLVFPFLSSQRFIFDDLLCDWGLNPERAYTENNALSVKSIDQIRGKRFFYLKFFHRFDGAQNRGVFWKYRYLSTDIFRVYTNFYRGVAKGYVRGYHPEALPHSVLSFFRHSTLFQHSWRTVNKKRLHVYRQNNKAALMMEDRFIAFIDTDSKIYWIGRVSNKAKIIEALQRESKRDGSLVQPSLFS